MDDFKKIYDPIEVDDDYFAFHESEQNELYAKIGQLPEPVEDVLFGINTAKIIENTCQSYQLNSKQSQELSRLIRKILVAEIYLGNIVTEIAGKLGVGQEAARNIANRLLTELFAPALEDIKKMHVEKFGSKQGEAPLPASTPVTAPKPEQSINPNNVLNLRK